MKTSLLAILVFLLILGASCENKNNKGPQEVEIKAFDYAFAAPDTIPSGWTRFKMANHGKEEHFMLINPLAEGVEKTDLLNAVDIIQELHDEYDSGEIDKDEVYRRLGNSLGQPDDAVRYKGGPGFLSVGHTVEATSFLEPGRYVIECYVRTPKGVQHNKLGMIRTLIVTEGNNSTSAPESDFEITLTNEAIKAKDTFERGRHTFKVNFEEHPKGYIGNDVHLIRIDDENIKMDEVAKWMDVFEKGGLVSPAPATFLGGTNEMPVENSAYFSLNLEPGIYAWISEMDYDMKKWKKFVVE